MAKSVGLIMELSGMRTRVQVVVGFGFLKIMFSFPGFNFRLRLYHILR